MLPVIIDASSDNMSPKMLFVTIVSNCSDTGNLLIWPGCNDSHRKTDNSQSAMNHTGKQTNLLRIPNKLHCSIVDIHVREFNVREFRR